MMLVSRYRTEIILFLASFILHAAFVGAVQIASGAEGFISHADSEFFFHRLATNLVENGVFSAAQQAPYYTDAYHTPLYPLFLAVFLLMHMPLWGIALIQGMLASLTIVLAYRIAKLLTDSSSIALGTSLFMLLEPMALYWSGMLMSDSFFAFLFTLAIYLTVRKRLYATALVLGFAALTRPIALYLAPAFIAMHAYGLYGEGMATSRIVRNAVLAACILGATIFPWFLHNRITSDTWSFTSAAWYEFYVTTLEGYAAQYALAIPRLDVPPDPDFSRFNFEYVPFYRDTFFALVKEHPFGYAIVHMQRALYSVVSNRYEYLVEVVVKSELPKLYAAFPHSVVMSILAMGTAFWILIHLLALVALAEPRLRPWWLFFAALAGANFAVGGAINPDGGVMSRYMLALYAPFFIFAIVGMQIVGSRFKEVVLKGKSPQTRRADNTQSRG